MVETKERRSRVSEDGPRRAVCYVRVSDAEQVKGYSMRQQEEALRGWCADEGFEVLEVACDPGVSGTHLDRGGLDRARELVEEGGVSVVVAQDRNRFAREPAYLFLLKREFERHGTLLRALNDRGDDSPEGDLTDGILDQLAKFERAKMLERTRRGTERALKEGKLVRRGRRPPFGFVYSEDNRSLTVYEPEMGVVRRIFEMVGSGESLHAVAKRLTEEGVPTPGGGRWNTSGKWKAQSVGHIVAAEIYLPLSPAEVADLVSPEMASTLSSSKSSTNGSHGPYGMWTFGRRRQERYRERDEGAPGGYRERYVVTLRPPEEWRRVPVPLRDAGLNRAVVERARERAKDVKKRPPSAVANRMWTLSGGIARCAGCGASLSPHQVKRRASAVSRGGPEHNLYYRCRTRFSERESGVPCGAKIYRPADELEEAVWIAVRDLLGRPDRLMREYDLYVERRKRKLRGDPERDARDMAQRLQKLERRRDGYMQMRADGEIGAGELREKLSGVDYERDGLQRTLAEARGRAEALERLDAEREIAKSTFSRMARLDLLAASPEERRSVFLALGLRADVDLSGPEGGVRVSGMFDTYVADLLPFSADGRTDGRSFSAVLYQGGGPEVSLTSNAGNAERRAAISSPLRERGRKTSSSSPRTGFGGMNRRRRRVGGFARCAGRAFFGSRATAARR
ncbi:MAG: recombinase family protein [Rubrobacter sp.]|jgi:site-specific DNA recombinase|nr:recombinase family protein [Rubrobacter sp.]